jgi:hypothetical protein
VAKLPGIDAVALSCVEESVVPKVIFAGLSHVMIGVAFGVTSRPPDYRKMFPARMPLH